MMTDVSGGFPCHRWLWVVFYAGCFVPIMIKKRAPAENTLIDDLLTGKYIDGVPGVLWIQNWTSLSRNETLNCGNAVVRG